MLIVGEEFLEQAKRELLLAVTAEYVSIDVEAELDKFLRLHELYRDRLMAERLDQWLKHHPEHLYGRGVGVKIAFDLIDPKTRMLQEHGFDELVFGGFLCTLCSPENNEDPDLDVMWPCPILRSVGLTEQEAIDHITAERLRWAREREEKNHG